MLNLRKPMEIASTLNYDTPPPLSAKPRTLINFLYFLRKVTTHNNVAPELNV